MTLSFLLTFLLFVSRKCRYPSCHTDKAVHSARLHEGGGSVGTLSIKWVDEIKQQRVGDHISSNAKFTIKPETNQSGTETTRKPSCGVINQIADK